MKRLCPHRLGSLVQANAGHLSLLLSLALLILCAAINSAKLDVELSNWIQRTTRIENELQMIESAIGDGAGSNSLLILQIAKQTSKTKDSHDTITKEAHKLAQNILDESSNKNNEGKNNNDILSVESMMIHLEALAIATHVTIDLFDVSWSLKDLCMAPTPPDYEGLLLNQMLNNLMPCVIKTPLDCFWEGAKLLGPEQDVRLSSIGPKLKWTNLNPMFMIEMQQRTHPHATFPYNTLLQWMRRVGITNGYLDRPCLDPSDPACPSSAPNKQSGETPNVGHVLTGGCHGLATKQMHWKEEELVGGVSKNRSGFIVDAEALQSTVLLMGERDVYEYWRKTSKVQDFNWTIDKAKLVLDSWQKRFKEELAQFTRSSMTSNSFKIHALTPKSMLEPVDNDTVLDLNNFKVAAIFMTIFTCIVFPNFKKSDDETGSYNINENCSTSIDRFKITLMALSVSAVVITTFIASLGLSSFINLPLNMATTQILPPLALFYGFRQALMIAYTYAEKYKHTPSDELTTECLIELMPIIVMESAAFIIPLIVATAFPVQATRVFTLQAITFILLSTLMAALLINSLLTIFLVASAKQHHEDLLEVRYNSDRPTSRCRSLSPGVLSIMSKRSNKSADETQCPSVDEQIFSRLQDDLKNIKQDINRPTNFNFSARFGPDGFRTSISLRTSADQKEQKLYDFRSRDCKTPEPTFSLPDLLLRTDSLVEDVAMKPIANAQIDERDELYKETDRYDEQSSHNVLSKFVSSIAGNRALSLLVVLFKVLTIVIILSQAPRVKFGLQLHDLLLRGTDNYESFMIREKYFPIYNIFTVTKSGLDYPSKQKVLYEFHERISNVDGVLKVKHGIENHFWLTYFRDWLLELQDSFDQERNRSAISKDGWTDDASDSAKLAYKLLAQTGKIDNPINKDLIESNRLVDKNGIINQKAFYYYLTAWVMNDAFTYANSEADFKPEPKSWNENPNDLRIERARPLTYAQIPFLLKLPEGRDNMKSILEIRSISQKFELIDLPNFPTGIPFVFWDQFINLDYLYYTALFMISSVLFILIGLAFTDFIVAAILIVPTLATLFEIYCLLGYLSVPFNSIMGVMIISIVGIVIAHQIQTVTCFEFADGDPKSRASNSVCRSFSTVIISLVLLSATALVFHSSKIDFMTKYSRILIYVIVMSAYNSLLVTPALLTLFGPYQTTEPVVKSSSRSPVKSPARNSKLMVKTIREKQIKKQHHKSKRGYPRVQSEISLSTISEESQSEAQAHDLKLNFSFRC